MQYLNSSYNGGSGDWACCGGWLDDFANFYTDTGMTIPWSNDNAEWQDDGQTCGQSTSVPAGTISTAPNYSIASINDVTIPTQTVTQAAAIANIKNILGQNRAVFFGFFLPTQDAWDDFTGFWSSNGETVVYQIDQFCGIPDEYEGGHAVLCVGYDDSDPDNSYWIMLNSWGTAGGNRPNGLFRVDMDMDYGCSNPGGGYSFFWQTLNVSFDAGNNPPQLSNPSVQPPGGDPSTDFSYSVIYKDIDGDSPSVKQVYVDGIPYNMSFHFRCPE